MFSAVAACQIFEATPVPTGARMAVGGAGLELGRRFDAVVTVTFSKVWHLKILVV